MLELFSLSFFKKWWNSLKPFSSCMSKQYFCQTFFLTKNTVEIYLIYWNVFLWILPDCLTFHRNPTKFCIYIPLLFFLKKLYTYNLSILYCYQFLMLLFVRISPGTTISHHLFGSWERFDYLNVFHLRITFFQIINQKVGYPAIYIYTIYFPNILLS